jgi:hypothetical protein
MMLMLLMMCGLPFAFGNDCLLVVETKFGGRPLAMPTIRQEVDSSTTVPPVG